MAIKSWLICCVPIVLLTVYMPTLILHCMEIFNKLSKEKPAVYDVYQLKFKSYLTDFNKSYSNSDEYERRFENFKANLKDIARLNVLEGNAVFGLTKFSDMSKQEFADRMLMKPNFTGQCRSRYRPCVDDHIAEPVRYGDGIPPSFDWRNKNVVKPVLNQKLCSGCWAFSIVGIMESMAALKLGDHESRSIQELIDCSKYNNGCEGGSVSLAMDFLCDTKLAIVTEEQYPLALVTSPICKLPEERSGLRLKNFAYQCNVEEELIVNEIYSHGPLVAAVDATNWINYIGGVIRWACNPEVSNHVIQIVGYDGLGRDSDTDPPYYIVRNSYGEDFGDQGYVKIAIGHNVCGIAEQVTMINVI